jgi:hypothetical protein
MRAIRILGAGLCLVASVFACSSSQTPSESTSPNVGDESLSVAAAAPVGACAPMVSTVFDRDGTIVPFILATTGQQMFAVVSSTTVTSVATAYIGNSACPPDHWKKGGNGPGGGCAVADAGSGGTVYFTATETSQLVSDASTCTRTVSNDAACLTAVGVHYCGTCKCCTGYCPATIAQCSHLCM